MALETELHLNLVDSYARYKKGLDKSIFDPDQNFISIDQSYTTYKKSVKATKEDIQAVRDAMKSFQVAKNGYVVLDEGDVRDREVNLGDSVVMRTMNPEAQEHFAQMERKYEAERLQAEKDYAEGLRKRQESRKNASPKESEPKFEMVKIEKESVIKQVLKQMINKKLLAANVALFSFVVGGIGVPTIFAFAGLTGSIVTANLLPESNFKEKYMMSAGIGIIGITALNLNYLTGMFVGNIVSVPGTFVAGVAALSLNAASKAATSAMNFNVSDAVKNGWNYFKNGLTNGFEKPKIFKSDHIIEELVKKPVRELGRKSLSVKINDVPKDYQEWVMPEIPAKSGSVKYGNDQSNHRRYLLAVLARPELSKNYFSHVGQLLRGRHKPVSACKGVTTHADALRIRDAQESGLRR